MLETVLAVIYCDLHSSKADPHPELVPGDAASGLAPDYRYPAQHGGLVGDVLPLRECLLSGLAAPVRRAPSVMANGPTSDSQSRGRSALMLLMGGVVWGDDARCENQMGTARTI